MVHNGEINTIKGNADRMLAREETMTSPYLEDEMSKITPVVNTNGSDSAMLDNTLEFFVMNGMPLPLAVMITIPEPWINNGAMAAGEEGLLPVLCNNDGALGWSGFYRIYRWRLLSEQCLTVMVFVLQDIISLTMVILFFLQRLVHFQSQRAELS